MSIESDLRMSGNTFGLNLLPRRETLAVVCRRIEQFQRRLAGGSRPVDQCRPHHVSRAAIVDGDSGAVFRTAIEHPLVLTHANRTSKCSAAITGQCERNVTNIA